MVLNQSYEPLTVCSPKKAITLLFLEKADVVEFYDNKFIRTVDKQYALPSVIKLARYVRFPFRMVEISRRNVLKRDANTCQYCGSRNNLTVDHIIPRSRGGKDTWDNLVTACVSCNNKKGNRTPREASMRLRTEPSKPNYFVFMKATLGKIEDKWQQFLYF